MRKLFISVAPSKNTASPTVVIGAGPACDETVMSAKNGIVQRVEKFGFDADGNPNFPFAGPIGLDFNCDGTADVVTWNPGRGTGGVIPGAENGKGQNRANCTGVMDFEAALQNGCFGV